MKKVALRKLFQFPSQVSRLGSCPSVIVVIKSYNEILIMIIHLTSRKAPSCHSIYSYRACAYISHNFSTIMQLIGVFHINFVVGSSWQKAWNRRTVTVINENFSCWIFIASTAAVASLFTFSSLNINCYRKVYFNSLLWNRNSHWNKWQRRLTVVNKLSFDYFMSFIFPCAFNYFHFRLFIPFSVLSPN